MHKEWRDIGLRKNRVEQLPIHQHKADMRQAILFTGKYGMEALMLALK